MLHRLRAQIRFTKASGLATWAYNQMVLRHTQAVYINSGLANEEPKYNEVVPGTTHDVYRCDLPLMNAAHAQDAYNTLGAASVFHPAYVSAFPDDDTPSWIEYHACGHDEGEPCSVVSRKTLP